MRYQKIRSQQSGNILGRRNWDGLFYSAEVSDEFSWIFGRIQPNSSELCGGFQLNSSEKKIDSAEALSELPRIFNRILPNISWRKNSTELIQLKLHKNKNLYQFLILFLSTKFKLNLHSELLILFFKRTLKGQNKVLVLTWIDWVQLFPPRKL